MNTKQEAETANRNLYNFKAYSCGDILHPTRPHCDTGSIRMQFLSLLCYTLMKTNLGRKLKKQSQENLEMKTGHLAGNMASDIKLGVF